MSYKLKTSENDIFFKAVLGLETLEDCYSFFEDICSISELESISQRLQVAIMLENKNTYKEICKKTNVSTATISRVNRALEYGSDGYKTVIKKLKEKNLI